MQSSALPTGDTAVLSRCRVCGSLARRFATATLLRQYEVRYYRCDDCHFTQTEEPYWLAEAYESAIVATDVGIVRRNLVLATVTKAIIEAFLDHRRTFIDFGAGYGLLVRLLRDQGYDFRWTDKYAENLFARGFEAERGNGDFELLTAFEVFEHLPLPVEAVSEMLTYSPNILFSTTLMPESLPGPQEWWYYALGGGQHVALYSRRSLEVLARRFNKNFYTDRRAIHLLTDRRLPAGLFSALARYRVARIVDLFRSRRSLTESDHEARNSALEVKRPAS